VPENEVILDRGSITTFGLSTSEARIRTPMEKSKIRHALVGIRPN
jgi:hypothetical protein